MESLALANVPPSVHIIILLNSHISSILIICEKELILNGMIQRTARIKRSMEYLLQWHNWLFSMNTVLSLKTSATAVMKGDITALVTLAEKF